jgi:G3E family GTPase
VIDAVHFLDAYEVYASLEKQIASSTVFIINKTDLASSETIENTKKVVRKFHPEPLFFETTYADIPLESFFNLANPTSATPETSRLEKPNTKLLSNEELEQFIDDLLDNPDLEITPPDALMSVSYHWKGDNLGQISTMAEALPSSIVRAKGFVEENNDMYLFNYVMGTWTVEETTVPKNRIQHRNVVVFIGPPESMEGIEDATKTGDWSSKGVFQPYSQS